MSGCIIWWKSLLHFYITLWTVTSVVHIKPSCLSQVRPVDSSRPVMSSSSWPAGAQVPVTPTPCASSRCHKRHRTVTHSSTVHTSLPSLPHSRPSPTPAGLPDRWPDVITEAWLLPHRPVDHHHLDVVLTLFLFILNGTLANHNLVHPRLCYSLKQSCLCACLSACLAQRRVVNVTIEQTAAYRN